jgi:hypothetical protein
MEQNLMHFYSNRLFVKHFRDDTDFLCKENQNYHAHLTNNKPRFLEDRRFGGAFKLRVLEQIPTHLLNGIGFEMN